MGAASHEPGGRPSDAGRRALLVGAFGSCCAAVLARLAPTTVPVAATAPLPSAATPLPVSTTTTTTAPTATTTSPHAGVTFDLVLRGGRVIDPETGFDAVADVGITGGAIAAVAAEALAGTEVVDATGLVVAPGFIDLLSYDPNPYGSAFKVADGVTTNLCMHGVNAEPGPWFARWAEEPPPLHHGGAFDHAWARARLGLGAYDRASPAQVDALRAMAEVALAGGYLGIALQLEYTPGVASEEVVAMGQVAAAAGVPAFFHARHSDTEPPGTNAEAVAEVLDVARATGAPVHLVHLTSTGGTRTMDASLAAMQAGRDEGLDVTGCLYPYDFWAARAASSRFDGDWQRRFGITHGDLVVPGTGERLAPETFATARRENTLLAALAIPEADVRAGLRSPLLVVGSDAILEPGDNNHPRAAGTFARVLGRYVRDEGVLDLRTALAKMTVRPARRLQAVAPALARKGRLQVGADADVCVFDPATVADRATLAEPATASAGIEWVLVAGQVVKDPDGVRDGVRPGQAIRRGT